MHRRVLTILLIAVGVGAVLFVRNLFADSRADTAYIHRIERELIALANDKPATAQRISAIKKHADNWSDGRVGITADGYIFYYDLHESHGADSIRDLHILYLPDEKRLLVIRNRHFCYELSKLEQARNKAEVIHIFTSTGIPNLF